MWISKVLDPRYAYLVFFPLMFHFNRSSGVRTLWTAAVVEWLNHVSKWYNFVSVFLTYAEMCGKLGYPPTPSVIQVLKSRITTLVDVV